MAHQNLGTHFNELKQYQDSLGHLHEALRINPLSDKAHNGLAIAYISLAYQQHRPDFIDKALEHGRQAIELDPSFAAAHYNLGLVFASQDMWVEAIERLQETLTLDPYLQQQIHPKLAVLYLNQGKALAGKNQKAAFACYEKALEHAVTAGDDKMVRALRGQLGR